MPSFLDGQLFSAEDEAGWPRSGTEPLIVAGIRHYYFFYIFWTREKHRFSTAIWRILFSLGS
jgi:hypothetical protein